MTDITETLISIALKLRTAIPNPNHIFNPGIQHPQTHDFQDWKKAENYLIGTKKSA